MKDTKRNDIKNIILKTDRTKTKSHEHHLSNIDNIYLLSEEYISDATKVQQMTREGGYGYFIWKYRDGFSINGKLKQKCYVLPKRDLVITYLSHIEDDSHGLVESMEKHILGL